MKLVYQEYALDEVAIDTISASVQAYLKSLRMESSSIQRIRLTVEELLLNILKHCGRGKKILIGFGTRFGRNTLNLRYESDPFDPSGGSDTPLRDDMMRSLGLFPAWNCRGKINTVSLVLTDRPKHSTPFYLLIAVLSAVILGLLGPVFPENVRRAITESVLSPAADCFLGLLNTFTGVTICLTICNGILGMGDSATLGRVGRTVLSRFVGISFAISVAAAVAVFPFIHLNFSTGVQDHASAFGQITRMFFDILPTNIIDPFRTGNSLHIIVISIFIACGLLSIGESGKRIRHLIGESAILFQRVISLVCTLIPLFVFNMLLRLFWSGKIPVLLQVLKPILLIAVFILLCTVAIWLLSSLRLKCPPMLLLKKVWPPFIVAFASASSVSAFSLGMEACDNRLGVRKSLASFIYPLGSVIYMPLTVIFFTVLVFCLAEIYQVAVDSPWVVTAILTCTLLTIAIPPISGADLLCYSILFSSLGIPAEGIILATAVSLAIDHLDTGTNVMLLLFEITCCAQKLTGLNRKILLRDPDSTGSDR
ncbi:MAG: cation:dicarboxylase symporter family transporter [Clostridia bacterium]|nr:cation:dicarboxylase symporter family transporter [Clostridia bacterium]